jgi:alcohol dehydrogenase (cytochrome c)
VQDELTPHQERLASILSLQKALDSWLPHLSRRAKILGLVLLAMLVLGAAALLSPTYRWSSVLAGRKVFGLLPEISWADLRVITTARFGFQLERLAKSGDPYSALHDPFLGVAAALTRGQEVFTLNCVKCHGAQAKGGLGPALVGRTLKHGGSDWALYHTITTGVPGTPMQGGFIERADAWLVIAYLRKLEESIGNRRTAFKDPFTVTLDDAPEATYSRLLASSSAKGEWLLPGGAYDGKRFARDTEVSVANVSGLAVQWIHQFSTIPMRSGWNNHPEDPPNESVPIVDGDYLYVTVAPDSVYALDARTGAQIWRYTRPIPDDIRICCIAVNRGVSVLGRRVYFGTLDAHLIALDASSGKVLWDQQVAEYTDGYSITSAPLPIGDFVVTGTGNGEFPARGFLTAYDAATGKLRWRFRTIPDAGEPGGNTWDPHAIRAGASTWGIGSYDPELGLLYWGVGNAAPDFNAAVRRGDDLYSNSMLALNAKTGKLVWYFQFLPGDDHDWDSIQTPSLLDVEQNGVVQKWLAVANRGGFFYVLDRQTGRFIRGAPFAKQTWALGLSPSGRPIRAPNSGSSPQGTFVYPSVNGATNSSYSAFSPLTQLYYVNVEEGGGLFFQGPASVKRGRFYFGGTGTTGNATFTDLVRAIDPVTAQVRWERRNSTVTSAPRGGLLATAGGVLFGSDGMRLFALEAATGKELWSFGAGGHIGAAPITYRSGDRQFIAVVAGQDLLAFALQPSRTDRAVTAVASARTPSPTHRGPLTNVVSARTPSQTHRGQR